MNTSMRPEADSQDISRHHAHDNSEASDESFRSLQEDAESANSTDEYEDCCSPNNLPVAKAPIDLASSELHDLNAASENSHEEDPEPHENPEGLLAKAEVFKASGNELFKQGSFTAAIQHYDDALKYAPPDAHQRAIYHANSAACHLSLENWKECARCCTDALAIDATYVKALRRRMTAYEKIDELDHALADAKQILELEPGDVKTRFMVAKWEPVVKERQEKMKEEVMGKLKDLGNSVLGRFGMSLDNFKMDKDPETGGYSVRFEQ